MNDNDEIGVFLGLDVGKSAHHGHVLTPAGVTHDGPARLVHGRHRLRERYAGSPTWARLRNCYVWTY
ncbi:hypothetical protein [Streptomyces sp. CMB-StM0423]|uniref:hypothetical protein n=1 Tax=Streptomyces sp. CMB-StM0423 TaxID=2059884 RepID=UPI0018FE4CD4|nr:hypothetical protein [Streptomyces sp. CMB-StM0423]